MCHKCFENTKAFHKLAFDPVRVCNTIYAFPRAGLPLKIFPKYRSFLAFQWLQICVFMN